MYEKVHLYTFVMNLPRIEVQTQNFEFPKNIFCVNYFAKCETKWFRNVNAIGYMSINQVIPIAFILNELVAHFVKR